MPETTEKKQDDKHSVTVRLDDGTFNAVKKLADEDERSVAQFVERHLRKAFQPKSGQTD